MSPTIRRDERYDDESGLILVGQGAAEGAGSTPSFLALANIGQAAHTLHHHELYYDPHHEHHHDPIMDLIMDLMMSL